jgi:hypothetical protein
MPIAALQALKFPFGNGPSTPKEVAGRRVAECATLSDFIDDRVLVVDANGAKAETVIPTSQHTVDRRHSL